MTASTQILGETLLNIINNRLDDELSRRYFDRYTATIQRQAFTNAWHTPTFIRHALRTIGESLTASHFQTLRHNAATAVQRRAVIHTGITPLEGFDDLLAIILNGDHYIGKLATQDKLLIPLTAELLTEIEPRWKSQIEFTERLPNVDHITATDNGNRTLNAYLNQHPLLLHLTKPNVAVMTGEETNEELALLATDLLLYFGMGRQAISKLYVPEGYNFAALFGIMEETTPEIASHHQYLNQLDYQKTILMMSQTPFLDAGIMAFVNDKRLKSPIAVTYTETYTSMAALQHHLEQLQPEIGYISSIHTSFVNRLPLGKGHNFAVNFPVVA